MPIQAPQWTEFLSCPVCYNVFNNGQHRPISLACSHAVCCSCLSKLQQRKCPFDQTQISCSVADLPVNFALLQLVCPDAVTDDKCTEIPEALRKHYTAAKKCIEGLALLLKPVTSSTTGSIVTSPPTSAGVSSPSCVLSRPMQRKLITLINCQLMEGEGRARTLRAARSLGERTVTELILQHQNPQQLSSNLWAAVRGRGCQFLGPAMQEEVLKLILLALEDGSALSRKVLVLFVVQRLESQYPQASKTAIGHVVQLLYRASCFKVTKRDEESSLMQLKEEFRTYESLRREHDTQVVQIAMEAGLRIAPDQWSSLLYGDSTHKSHMQSIIDKLQTPQTFGQSVSELVIALQRTGDPFLLQRLQPQLEFLSSIDSGPDVPSPSWENLEGVVKAAKTVVEGLVDFLQQSGHKKHDFLTPFNVRYKTSMCRDFIERKLCPRGSSCTFAHSEDELEKYRQKNKKAGKLQSSSQDNVTPGESTDLSPPLYHADLTRDTVAVRDFSSLSLEAEKPSLARVAAVAPSLAQLPTRPPVSQSTSTFPPDHISDRVPGPGMAPPFDRGTFPGIGHPPPAPDACGRFPGPPMNMMYGQYPYSGVPFMPFCPPGFMPYSRLNPYAEPWTPCSHQHYQQYQAPPPPPPPPHHLSQPPMLPAQLGQQSSPGGMPLQPPPPFPLPSRMSFPGQPGGHGQVQVPDPGHPGTCMSSQIPRLSTAVPQQQAVRLTTSTTIGQTPVTALQDTPGYRTVEVGAKEECSVCSSRLATQGPEVPVQPVAPIVQSADMMGAPGQTLPVTPVPQLQAIPRPQTQVHRQSLSHLHERRHSLLAQLQHCNSGSKDSPVTTATQVTPSNRLCNQCAGKGNTNPYQKLTQQMSARSRSSFPGSENMVQPSRPFDLPYPSLQERENLMLPPQPRDLSMPIPVTKKTSPAELFERLEAISALPPRSVADSIMASWVTSALPSSVEPKNKPQVSMMNVAHSSLPWASSATSTALLSAATSTTGALAQTLSTTDHVQWSMGSQSPSPPGPGQWQEENVSSSVSVSSVTSSEGGGLMAGSRDDFTSWTSVGYNTWALAGSDSVVAGGLATVGLSPSSQASSGPNFTSTGDSADSGLSSSHANSLTSLSTELPSATALTGEKEDSSIAAGVTDDDSFSVQANGAGELTVPGQDSSGSSGTPSTSCVASRSIINSESASCSGSSSIKGTTKKKSQSADTKAMTANEETYWQSQYEDFPYWEDVTRTLESPTPASKWQDLAVYFQDEEDFIPFDPPIVSKFGPISRMARSKYKNTGPVQVTADEMMKTTPVTAVTQLARPVPSAQTVPSIFSTGSVVMHSAESQPPASLVHSGEALGADMPTLWSSVAELEQKAHDVTTEEERLSCELQAVEMQISMRQQQLDNMRGMERRQQASRAYQQQNKSPPKKDSS